LHALPRGSPLTSFISTSTRVGTDDGRRQRNGDRDAARSYYLRCRDGYAQTKGPAHADTLDAGKLAAALA